VGKRAGRRRARFRKAHRYVKYPVASAGSYEAHVPLFTLASLERAVWKKDMAVLKVQYTIYIGTTLSLPVTDLI